MIRTSLCVALVAIACGKSDGTKAGGDKPAGPAVTQADVDAINAQVPAELKDKVQFELGKIVDDFGRKTTTYTLATPKGWKKGFMPGSLEPADADNFGSKTLGKTSMQVGNNCDGSCSPKDWAAIVEKTYYKQFTSGEVTGKVIKDDKGQNRRTLVFQTEPKEAPVEGSATINGQAAEMKMTATTGSRGIEIITTWWTDGASSHYVCKATLAEPAMGLAAAIEKACDKVSVTGG